MFSHFFRNFLKGGLARILIKYWKSTPHGFVIRRGPCVPKMKHSHEVIYPVLIYPPNALPGVYLLFQIEKYFLIVGYSAVI